jgi:hypothetical protein
MPESPLRGHILRLAVQNPKLRPRLVQILREAGGLTEDEKRTLKRANQVIPGVAPGQQPIVIQQVVHQGQPQTPAAPVGIITSPLAPVAPEAPAVPVAAPAAVPGAAPVSPNQSPIGVPEETPAAPVSALGVPERAAHGFNAELLPEMQKLLAAGMSKAQVARDMLDLVKSSFAKKDSLYNILIRYQSSFESNEEYLENIERLIEAWATSNDGA